MIKFFRKIRQNLLSEGKTGKYFKYAIGEIVLVVIGILIALQINNWNEQNKIDKSINSHLEILKQNLIEDQAQLQNLKENMTENIKCADSSMAQIKTIIPVNNSMKKYLVLLVREFQFSPNTNGIETITQSNEIPSLNTELRNAVLNYYALIERTEEREHISNTQIQSKYEPYINTEYPDIFQKDNDWEFIGSFYKDDPRPTSSIDDVKLLKDKTLESLLVSRYYQCVALENFYGELIISSDKILSILEKKIN
jgi:competence protein ComGC